MDNGSIKVGGKLASITSDGVLADASQIVDSNQSGKSQQEINQEYGDAIAKKIETVDTELIEDSTNPVQGGAVYKALTDDERVIAAALNDLNTKLLRKKRIYIKSGQNTQAMCDGSWVYATPGETIYFLVQTGTASKSVTFTIVPLDSSKSTPVTSVENMGVNSTIGTSISFWKVGITIPNDVEDNDIYIYKYTSSTAS